MRAYIFLLMLAGCANEFPACTWHEVSAQRLASECNDWDTKLMGCQKGTTTCELYVRKP
jgi:hypothetical protein